MGLREPYTLLALERLEKAPGRMPPTSRGANPSPPRSAPPERRQAPVPEAPEKKKPPAASTGVSSQVQKLRQVRESLGRYQNIDRAVSAVPGEGLRRVLYSRLGVEGARHLDPSAGLGTSTIPAASPTTTRRRRPMPVLGVLLTLGAAAGALAFVYDRTLPREVAAGSVVTVSVSPAPDPANTVAAEDLPILPKAVQPDTVWLVEKGMGSEHYSNGLRIDTTFAIKGDSRRYRVFQHPGGEMGDVATQPIGILYHTSESDIWPLDESNNERLRVSSQRLLQYIQRKRLYHYVIDRFGRVFRIVEEDAKANHAGFSIWSRGDQVYLNLNHAFIGICFETRWEGGQALPITQAQLSAGRNLTDHLRHRYKVSPEMCVTHGLTSVNPKKHLIGHHLDWARGFPFEAFGLPDHYARPAPSVSVFGFGYDARDLRDRLGAPWPGVYDAERVLEEEARRQGRPLEAVRREKQAVFDRWIADQAREDGGGNAAAPAAAAASPGA